jgi:biopolymer transport protein ExbD
MSGSVPGGAKVEPNLTPILDMVFQLITFFMLVINFKAAELDLTLMLPVLGSARPLPDGPNTKLLVLNVQVATKCPQCDALATLARLTDDSTIPPKVTGFALRCERGHETSFPEGMITNGKTALSVYGRLLTKQRRDNDHPSISEYLEQERELSRMAAKPPLTVDEIIKDGKELPDIVAIRADSTCPSGAVYYVVTECQKQGYRKFALKTGHVELPRKPQ